MMARKTRSLQQLQSASRKKPRYCVCANMARFLFLLLVALDSAYGFAFIGGKRLLLSLTSPSKSSPIHYMMRNRYRRHQYHHLNRHQKCIVCAAVWGDWTGWDNGLAWMKKNTGRSDRNDNKNKGDNSDKSKENKNGTNKEIRSAAESKGDTDNTKTEEEAKTAAEKEETTRLKVEAELSSRANDEEEQQHEEQIVSSSSSIQQDANNENEELLLQEVLMDRAVLLYSNTVFRQNQGRQSWSFMLEQITGIISFLAATTTAAATTGSLLDTGSQQSVGGGNNDDDSPALSTKPDSPVEISADDSKSPTPPPPVEQQQQQQQSSTQERRAAVSLQIDQALLDRVSLQEMEELVKEYRKLQEEEEDLATATIDGGKDNVDDQVSDSLPTLESNSFTFTATAADDIADSDPSINAAAIYVINLEDVQKQLEHYEQLLMSLQ